MSRIYRCDRCGEPYDTRPPCEKARLLALHKGSRIPLDLCPECTDRLESWLHMGVINHEEVQSDET